MANGGGAAAQLSGVSFLAGARAGAAGAGAGAGTHRREGLGAIVQDRHARHDGGEEHGGTGHHRLSQCEEVYGDGQEGGTHLGHSRCESVDNNFNIDCFIAKFCLSLMPIQSVVLN